MAAENFQNYLPLVTSIRRYGNESKRFTKPLFPGYVFARIPKEGKSRIYQMELLARAIPVDDEVGFLGQIDQVRKMLSAGIELIVIPQLIPGRRIRILSGPFKGLEGFVDNSTNPSGIVISVDVLQQGLLIKMPADNLATAD